MQTYLTRSFAPAEDPHAAVQMAIILADACRTPAGDNLYRPEPFEWTERKTVLHIAQSAAGKIAAGCATEMEGERIYLSAAAADPTMCGQGAGGAAVDEAVRNARNRGALHIDLIVRLTDDGLPEPAVRLYRARGFRFLPGINVHAVCWQDSSRHLWRNPDIGQGTFRTRTMRLDFPQKEGGLDE